MLLYRTLTRHAHTYTYTYTRDRRHVGRRTHSFGENTFTRYTITRTPLSILGYADVPLSVRAAVLCDVIQAKKTTNGEQFKKKKKIKENNNKKKYEQAREQSARARVSVGKYTRWVGARDEISARGLPGRLRARKRRPPQ